jgi:hypothetical protein
MRSWLLAVLMVASLGGAAWACDAPVKNSAAARVAPFWRKVGVVYCLLQGWLIARQFRAGMRDELVFDHFDEFPLDYTEKKPFGAGFVMGSRRLGLKLWFRKAGCGEERLSGVDFFDLFGDWPEP